MQCQVQGLEQVAGSGSAGGKPGDPQVGGHFRTARDETVRMNSGRPVSGTDDMCVSLVGAWKQQVSIDSQRLE